MGRREMSQILANFIFLCLCTAVSGLYFHIAETEKKCFIEEIPDDTIVVGKFFVLESNNDRFRCHACRRQRWSVGLNQPEVTTRHLCQHDSMCNRD